jgi:hypothetical protein
VSSTAELFRRSDVETDVIQRAEFILKLFLWCAALLLALLWTGGIAIAVQIVEWSIAALASGSAAGLAEAAARVPIPEWLAPFVDLSGGRETLVAIAAGLQSLADVLPSATQSLGWLIPTLWVIWGVGVLGLAVLTVLASRLIGLRG